jgi:hypothetical protein
MEEREFEALLGRRLHRRFDAVQPSPELQAGLEQILSTRPQPVGIAMLRARRRELGWGALVAAAVIVALLVGNGAIGRLGPGAPTASPQASLVDGRDQQFIVVPPAGYELDKTDATLASDVLGARLRALLFVGESPNAFTTGVGNAITFIVPGGQPASDDSIRAVLRAPGRVAFVPLPASYADGTHTAVIGQNLPTDEPALFGRDGIAGATTELDQQGRPVLSITLQPAAADAFRAFTETDVGAPFAIVIDDDVALLPMINAPISDGVVQLSGGGPPGSPEQAAFAETAAIIAGGTLPDAWIAPEVPVVRPPENIVATLASEFGKVEPVPPASIDLTITSADLDAVLVGRRWTAVWRLGLEDLNAACSTPLPSDEHGICRWTDPTVIHLFDAETGEWLGPAPT